MGIYKYWFGFDYIVMPDNFHIKMFPGGAYHREIYNVAISIIAQEALDA